MSATRGVSRNAAVVKAGGITQNVGTAGTHAATTGGITASAADIKEGSTGGTTGPATSAGTIVASPPSVPRMR